jgi:hypothetical protein
MSIHTLQVTSISIISKDEDQLMTIDLILPNLNKNDDFVVKSHSFLRNKRIILYLSFGRLYFIDKIKLT